MRGWLTELQSINIMEYDAHIKKNNDVGNTSKHRAKWGKKRD